MKIIATLLSAVLIAGTSTLAMAQSGGSGGGAGSDVNPDQMGRGADANPSGLNADPMAGNRSNTMQPGEMGEYGNGERMNGMNSSNVSGQWNDQSWNQGRSDRRVR